MLQLRNFQLTLLSSTSKRGEFVGFPGIGRIITSSIWRRIRMGIAGLGAVECPLNLRSYKWGRRRNFVVDVVSIRQPRGYQIDMRFSAGKRRMFSALRSTGSLPVFRR